MYHQSEEFNVTVAMRHPWFSASYSALLGDCALAASMLLSPVTRGAGAALGAWSLASLLWIPRARNGAVACQTALERSLFASERL